MFTQISYRYWLPITGESVEGIFIAKEEQIEQDIQRSIYIFENETGAFAIRGNPPLDDQMTYVGINDRVRIVYVGLRPAQDTILFPTYQLWKNRWIAVFVSEEVEDEIPIL